MMTRFFTGFGESVSMALNAVASHKLRSALTMLGVLIGVFSIILVMTAVRAMQNKIVDQFGQMGSKTFVISRIPAAYFGGPEGFMKFFRRREITLLQAQRFKKMATFAPQVGLQLELWDGEVTSRMGSTPPNVSVQGGTPGLFPASNFTIVEGRPLLDSDVESVRDVCVLSKDVAKALFPLGSPIGQRVKVEAISYTVVGTFERLATEGDTGAVILPITTGLNRYGRRRDVSILVQAQDPATIQDAVEQARGMLRSIRKVAPDTEDDFEIQTSDSMIRQFEDVTFAVRMGLAVISSIALLAAGVGIMNIMLVSVTERTREIGVRRALGATKRSIMIQFIVEAIVLCELGGILGIVLGMAGADALAIYILDVPPAFPVDWAIAGLLICSAVGIIFGSYPAYKAANLDPIESLRYE